MIFQAFMRIVLTVLVIFSWTFESAPPANIRESLLTPAKPPATHLVMRREQAYSILNYYRWNQFKYGIRSQSWFGFAINKPGLSPLLTTAAPAVPYQADSPAYSIAVLRDQKTTETYWRNNLCFFVKIVSVDFIYSGLIFSSSLRSSK